MVEGKEEPEPESEPVTKKTKRLVLKKVPEVSIGTEKIKIQIKK